MKLAYRNFKRTVINMFEKLKKNIHIMRRKWKLCKGTKHSLSGAGGGSTTCPGSAALEVT